MLSYTPNAFKPLPPFQPRPTHAPADHAYTCEHHRTSSSRSLSFPEQDSPSFAPFHLSPNYRILYRSVSGHGTSLGRAALTQSVSVQPRTETTSNQDGGRAELVQTVQVLPVLRNRGASIANLHRSAMLEQTLGDASLAAADTQRRFVHNIGNREMQQRLQAAHTLARRQAQVTQSVDSHYGASSVSLYKKSDKDRHPNSGRSNDSNIYYQYKSFHTSLDFTSPPHGSGRPRRQNSTEQEFQCSCKLYHSHTFKGRPVNCDLVQETRKFVDTLTSTSRVEEIVEQPDDFRNIFWTPSLSFHPYHHGDKTVEFSDLWPSTRDLQEHFQNSGIQHTVLRDFSVLDLCKMAVVCGPLRLLKCLIDLQLVRIDQLVENGTGLLHLAVLSHNVEAIQYLTATKISPKLRDKSGMTADQVCYNGNIRRHLPTKYQVSKESSRLQANLEGRMQVKASLQDKDTIFKLASNPKYFDDIQKKLQTLDFNVNTECDTNGDFLLHIACQRGLSQLPLIMALVKIQGADVELCNAVGETPLIICAAAGNPVLCDVMMCLFGADPNKPNSNTGRCALHYAVEGNHRKTVECLIRRGADVNCEDHMGRRPDDVPLCQGTNDDCHEIIHFNRTRRIEALVERIKKGELEKHHLTPSDLFVVDAEGYTLVMMAAIYNRADAVDVLLLTNDTTINAQHVKTGMTALAIAAQMGNNEAVTKLLCCGANPAIGDMNGYLPLHFAVLNNQEKVVDTLLEYFPQCYAGLYLAARLCKRTSIHVKLKSAFCRRQEEIVTPKLLACAMSGAADELYQTLDDGDNINPKSGTGNWPLYLAVENGHLHVVRLLVEKGGDICKRHSTTGETVLHIAAKMGHTEIMRYLLSFCRRPDGKTAGSQWRPSRRLMDINTTDLGNRTPLQLAAEKGFSKIVEMLLGHGATTALLDASGQLITCPQFEGVRMQIESHRQEHMKDVVTLITDRNKKAFELLQKIWLPKFDHNLRTKLGDTPLMVACAAGKLQILKLLLESAFYSPAQPDSDHSDDDSDADSGVLDPSAAIFRKTADVDSYDHLEELQGSGVFSHSTEETAGIKAGNADLTRSTEVIREKDVWKKAESYMSSLPHSVSDNNNRTLEALLKDVNRPKGLYIYHDNMVSHVCAVNLFDGSTALHRAIESGDSPQLARALLSTDKTCVNIQTRAGLTPLHLACKLGRKKMVEHLLGTEGIDLNAISVDCLLPEEMTANKSIIRMVQKARKQHSGQTLPPTSLKDAGGDLHDDASSAYARSIVGSSTVNFDQVHSRYEALQNDGKH